jgi:hypothetical protein
MMSVLRVRAPRTAATRIQLPAALTIQSSSSLKTASAADPFEASAA